jgi:uncharacterized membrane protein
LAKKEMAASPRRRVGRRFLGHLEELVAGSVCVLAFVGVAVWLVTTLTRRGRLHELENSLRHLQERVRVLERHAAAAPVPAPTASPSAETPAPPPPVVQPIARAALERPAVPAATWTPTRVAAEPPPLPSEAPSPTPVPSPLPEIVSETEISFDPTSPRRRAAAAENAGFEAFVGGRVMLIVGVVVVLFGLAFFLKFAIDQGWIGAPIRIAMGVALGVGLLFGGQRLRSRFDVFGQALMGCGLGALYLSNYYACAVYRMLQDERAALGVAAATTALGVFLALRRFAPVLAYLGFLGGFLAPALLAKPTDTLLGITAWLVVLDAGVFFVLLRRAWHGLELMGLVFAVVYVAHWQDGHRVLAHSAPGTPVVCVAALVAATIVLGLVPALIRREAPPPTSLLGLAGASVALDRRAEGARVASQSLHALAAAALVTAVAEFATGVVVAPALSAVGVAVVFIGVRGASPALIAAGLGAIGCAFVDLLAHRLRLYDETMAPVFNKRFLLFQTPCVALVAASWILRRWKGALGALPSCVEAGGYWTLAIVVGACAFVDVERANLSRGAQAAVPIGVLAAYSLAVGLFTGRRDAAGRFLALGPMAATFLASAVMLVVSGRHVDVPLFDGVFLAGLAPCVAAVVAATRADPGPRKALVAAAVVWLFLVVTFDLYAWGEHGALFGLTREEAKFRAQVAVSVAWAVYAAALVGVGFWRDRPGLRWTGLGVFALTLAKAFLVDMARLGTGYRIASFVVLGALLVGASFLYQRMRASDGGDGS